MKKIIILLILLCPIWVYAECDQTTINELKSQINNVGFDLEYNDVTFDSGEKDDYFKISTVNLPDNFIVRLVDGDVMGYVLENGSSVTINGGVYLVEFLNIKCHGDLIDSYSMMIPYYDENSNDAWFDGTYGEKQKESSSPSITIKNNNIYLIAGGMLALLLIIIISSLLIKRRRKIK